MSPTLCASGLGSTCSTIWAPWESCAEKGPKHWLDKGDMRRNIVGSMGHGGEWDPLIDAQDEFSPSIVVMGGF
jgi:hypothetical protein